MAYSKTWGDALFSIHYDCATPRDILVSGRDRWGLEALIATGNKGCTPIDTPGPRWSANVFNLRQMSVAIDTIHEPHSGTFPGSLARYVLQCQVSRNISEVAQ